MNIIFTNQYAYTPYQAASSRHFAFARELIKRGHNVRIISSSFYHKHRKQEHLHPCRDYLNANVEDVPFTWLKTPGYRGNIMRIVNMLTYAWRLQSSDGIKKAARPDLIYATSPSPFAAMSAITLARKTGAVCIVEVVDLWPDTLIEVGGLSRWHPVVMLFRWVEKYIYRNADALVTHLANANLHFQSLGAKPEKCFYIPSPSPFDPIPQPPQPVDNDRLCFAYAGAMGKANALTDLLKAWVIVLENEPELRDRIKLVMIGDGAEKPRLQQFIHDSGYPQSVEFVDPVPKAEILQHLAETDVCMATSANHRIYRYGISFNKMFDYMAVAKPVILATNAPNTPVARAKSGIVIPPENSQRLAIAIMEMARMSSEQRRELGIRGYLELLKSHQIGTWGDTAEKLFSRLLQDRLRRND